MIDTMRRVNAALCDLFGWDPLTRVIQHAEWTRRKIDCAFIAPAITYLQFRQMVTDTLAAYYRDGAPQPPKEWDEMATKEEIESVVRDVVQEELKALAVGPYMGHQGALVQLSAISAEVVGGEGSRSIRKLSEMIWNALYSGDGKLKPVIARFLD
jgi:hypothetical protein